MPQSADEWMVSAGYTGTRGLHLLGQSLPNINKWEGWPNNPDGPRFWPGGTGLINPNFGEMRYQATQGNSFYHGLALSAQKRLSRGIQFQTSYNWAKAIDEGSGVTSTGEALPQSQRGIWQCVEAHAKLNDPGQSNGLFELWVNGKLDATRSGLNWVGSYTAYGINAVFVENYWNKGSPVVQERYFDNFVVSTARIGCGS